MLTLSRDGTNDRFAVDGFFATLRDREFSRLDETGLAYLDYTGSALPAAGQIRAHTETLSDAVFGNPHADSGPSRRSTATLDAARALVLRHLDADDAEYVVCFTANATSAVKLVAEGYPFAPDGAYVLSADNHNSLNGVREYARRASAPVVHIPLDDELRLAAGTDTLAAIGNRRGAKLFAFPAQSNFSGVRHPLSLVDVAHQCGFDVLLDAAAFLPSAALSLRAQRPAFVALSFYKLFGFPTGLGALVARRDALARLRRPWFAGGTVAYVSVQNDRHSLLSGALGFEDGTPHFLGAAALRAGFELLAHVGMDRLSSHVAGLTGDLMSGLRALCHADGSPALRMYGPMDNCGRGGAVAFNVVKRDGRIVPYPAVEERARTLGVAFRGGCFCNPGAAERAFGFDPRRAARCLDAAGEQGEFTIERFAACLSPDGRQAVGAVRASLGMANNAADVGRAIEVVRSFLE
jgi:selenocysteine lyase/cysteine desulfurase